MLNSRIVLILIGVTTLWAALILRAAQLQILPDGRLAELQKRQYRTLVELQPRRGTIFDRNGKELAVTIPTYSMFADPKIIKESRKLSRTLAKKMGWSPLFVMDKIRPRGKASEKRFVWLKRGMNKAEADSIKSLKLEGIGFVEESRRVYPNDSLLSQVMGFVGQEGRGLEGIELNYDALLRGESVKVRMERDARGRPLLVEGRLFSEQPTGADIELTIDSELQFVLEKHLEEAVVTHLADSAIGIVLDAQTSEVLAMSSAPTFDSNRPRDFDMDFWRNRSVTDTYEPGSTMKTLVIAGGLRMGSIKPSTKFFCENGKYKVGPHFIREADAKHAFGNLTVTEILSLSSNIGTTKIAQLMGDQNVYRTLQDFGIGEKTGLDLPGEARGVLKAPPWRSHLLANISFGHGVSASPMQIAAAYAAIANGGLLKRPYILKASQLEGEDKRHHNAHVIRRVLSQEQSAVMRMMLQQATSEKATGAAARVAGFPVGGKTGTAQKVQAGGGYGKDQYFSSFAGFVPAHDPKFVIYVAIDNPRNKYYGSEVAAPLFSRIAGYAVRKAGLSPIIISEKNMVQNKTEKRVQEEAITQIRNMASAMTMHEQNKVPNLKGLSLREVYDRVRGTDIKIRVSGRGMVKSSYPDAGDELPRSKNIQVWLE
jgi:cell division protein FtsI (penicillin-binding protein 3)